MKRPYRCNSTICMKRDTSNIAHLDPNEVADATCPHCEKNRYQRLSLIHLIKECDEGCIKGSRSNPDKCFTFNCGYAVNEYKRFLDGERPGNPVLGGFQHKETTCYECLFNDGCVFNHETNEFIFTEKLVGD